MISPADAQDRQTVLTYYPLPQVPYSGGPCYRKQVRGLNNRVPQFRQLNQSTQYSEKVTFKRILVEQRSLKLPKGVFLGNFPNLNVRRRQLVLTSIFIILYGIVLYQCQN